MSRLTIAKLLRAVSVLAAAVLLALLGWQFAERTPSLDVPHPHAARDGAALPACTTHSRPVLSLLLRRLDVAEGTVRVDSTLCVPTATLRRIRAYASVRHSDFLSHPTRVFTTRGLWGPVVRRPFAGLRLSFFVDASSPAGAYVRRLPLPLLDSQEGDDGDVVIRPLGTLTLPLLGNAEDYPFDQYSLDAGVGVFLPIFLSTHRDGDPDLAPRIEATAASDLRGYRVVAGMRHDDELIVRLRRAHRTQWFVLVLLLIPLLLIAVLLRVSARRKATAGADLVIGAAAVLLALLPIRAVLVPSDITSLTLVDYALACEVALLAAVVVFRESAT